VERLNNLDRQPHRAAQPRPRRTSPASAAKPHRNTSVRPDPPGPLRGFDVHAVWHPRFDRDAAVRWLRKCAIEAAAAIGSPDALRQRGV
jgi:DNA-binding transcriptional LysR family regulator